MGPAAMSAYGWRLPLLFGCLLAPALFILRRSLVEEVGGFDAEFEGSQDWDLVLRVTEQARSGALVLPRLIQRLADQPRLLAVSAIRIDVIDPIHVFDDRQAGLRDGDQRRTARFAHDQGGLQVLRVE